ncbi:hypothetical protein HPB50_008318 [Hyalomma asiaticum]|uniref:Uncharacterized protein n=1 Tax=Hyalomma asiaticum TaxID=266040 RepID=A0ACB7SWF2_HYAAI|nr:hypothetical protein HPB50_008318 [Hyalomma asiaticum]
MVPDDSDASSSDDEASGHGGCSKSSGKQSRSAALTCPSPTELLQSTRVVVLCNTLAVGTFCLLAVALLIAAVSRQQAAAAAEAATQPTTPASEEAVERRQATEMYKASDPPVVPASTRFVCVYRERVGQPGLNVRNFPYAYCHHLTYCCLSVLSSQGDRAALSTLSQLGTAMGGTPFSVSAIFGGSSTEDPYLLALLLDADSVQRLVQRLALVSVNKDESGATSSLLFSRAYLHWKRPQVRYKAAITRLADVLRVQLKPHSLRLGLVVDGDSDMSAAFDFPSLLDMLGDRALLVAPQSWSALDPRQGGHQSAETLSRHAAVGRLSEKYGDSVCHALSVAGVAVNGPETAIDIPYGSMCNMNFTNTYLLGQSTIGVTALGEVVSFLEPPNARDFVATLCREANTDCVAFWDLECDDYAATCGGPPFPLIKAVVGTPVA